MGDIASPAATDPDFGQKLFCFFKDNNVKCSIYTSGVDRAKKTGGAATDDDQFFTSLKHK
jgi:hypothetical protein